MLSATTLGAPMWIVMAADGLGFPLLLTTAAMLLCLLCAWIWCWYAKKIFGDYWYIDDDLEGLIVLYSIIYAVIVVLFF